MAANNTPEVSTDRRTPLEVAVAVGERFMRIRPRKPDYMYRVGLEGLLDLYEATKEGRYLDFHVERQDKEALRRDWRLFEITGERKWVEGIEAAAKRFLADPRRDREGCLLDPRGRYTIDVFSGQFMMAIVYGHLLRDERFFDEAAKLLEINRSYLEDPQSGVWYSRFGNSLHTHRPNPGLWSRGNGWLVGYWGRTMHLWDPSHRAYGPTRAYWQRYCESVAAFQTPSGLFRQLLNRADSFEEATGSGLFATGFARGILRGTLPPDLGVIAYRTFFGLRGLVDAGGSIHNASTYAGGYNFERQYNGCARFNEPHGDGTVMGGCVAVHLLLKSTPEIARQAEAPSVKPVIVTVARPGVLSTEPPPHRTVAEIAAPLAKRILTLENLPAHDPFGGTVLGLLHWYDYSSDPACLAHARNLFERGGGRLSAPVQWNLRAEIARRGAGGEVGSSLVAFLDSELKRAARDRNGVFGDEHGGYSIENLCRWLPLLTKAGTVEGERRWFDEACAQLLGHERWLEDPLTGFWYSAWGRGEHPRRVTPGLWALGNAYLLAGIVDLLEDLPPEHARYVDVVCLLRRLVERFHEYLPVGRGWRQVLDRLGSFPCNAASALITCGCARAFLGRWIQPEYHAVISGGVFHMGEMVDEEGNFEFSSRPEGGLDSVEAYEAHRLQNDDGALGLLLSGLAYGAKCLEPGMNPDADGTLGAR